MKGNSNTISINRNEEIVGQTAGDWRWHRPRPYEVCCRPDNTNDITINENGDITGLDDDGIDIDVCCSQNTLTISDNHGTITGNDDTRSRVRRG